MSSTIRANKGLISELGGILEESLGEGAPKEELDELSDAIYELGGEILGLEKNIAAATDEQARMTKELKEANKETK